MHSTVNRESVSENTNFYLYAAPCKYYFYAEHANSIISLYFDSKRSSKAMNMVN